MRGTTKGLKRLKHLLHCQQDMPRLEQITNCAARTQQCVEKFRLLLLTGAHLACQSWLKHTAPTEPTAPVCLVSLDASGQSLSHGWHVCGQESQFLLWPAGCWLFCFRPIKTNSFKHSCWPHSCFSAILTLQMGFRRNHILHWTVQFQGRVQWRSAFTLIHIKWQPIIFPLIEFWATVRSKVFDVNSRISWISSRPWLQ